MKDMENEGAAILRKLPKLKQEEIKNIVALLTNELKQDSDNSALYIMRAKYNLKMEDYKEAITDYERVDKLEPSDGNKKKIAILNCIELGMI